MATLCFRHFVDSAQAYTLSDMHMPIQLFAVFGAFHIDMCLMLKIRKIVEVFREFLQKRI